MSIFIRQTHRWVALIFVLIVVAIFVMQGMGKQPVQWVYYLPLIPLAFLALTGIYLFVLPYLRRN